MLLYDIIPTLPASPSEWFILLGGILCSILLMYAVFIEQEHRQDLMRLLGTGGLFWYAVYINNLIFMIAMAGIAIASAIEFVEIYLGLHKHGPEDLKRYKKMWRMKKSSKYTD
jgi:hypothetical protein